MIGINVQVGKQQRSFAGWFVASAVWLDGDEYGVNLCERFGVVEPQHQVFLGSVVDIEDAEIQCLLPVRSAPPPSLESAGILDPWLLVEIISVKNQRLFFAVKDAAVALLVSPVRSTSYTSAT